MKKKNASDWSKTRSPSRRFHFLRQGSFDSIRFNKIDNYEVPKHLLLLENYRIESIESIWISLSTWTWHALPNQRIAWHANLCGVVCWFRGGKSPLRAREVGPQDQPQRDLPRSSAQPTRARRLKKIKAAANPAFRRAVLEQPTTRPHHAFPRDSDSYRAVVPPRAGRYFRVASGDRTSTYDMDGKAPLLLVSARKNSCRRRRSGEGACLCSSRRLPKSVRWPFRFWYFKTHCVTPDIGSRTHNKKWPPHRIQFNLITKSSTIFFKNDPKVFVSL